MFTNLHTLPRGQHMYTAWVSGEPLGQVTSADEIDFVDSARKSPAELLGVVKNSPEFKESYSHCRVVALADQSTGEKLWSEKGFA